MPGRLLPVSCAIVTCGKGEVDWGWMRRGLDWSATGVAKISTGHARGARCEHAWRLLSCQAGYCCALRLACARVRVEGPFDDGLLAQALRT